MAKTWRVASPAAHFWAGAQVYEQSWIRLSESMDATERARAARALLAVGDPPAQPDEARWLCDLLLSASGAVAGDAPEVSIHLATLAADLVAGTVPGAEMVARGVLGAPMDEAGLLEGAVDEYRRAVTLSYEHGPVESRLMDLARICSLLLRLARHAEMSSVARELLQEATSANRRGSILVAYEFLGDAVAALGEWAEVLVLADAERAILAQAPGRNAQVIASAIDARVDRSRKALGQG